MSGIMPPEPPPVSSEADYANSGNRRAVSKATVVDTTSVAFYGTDLPIPSHLLNRTPTPELNKAMAKVLAESDESIPKRGHNTHFNYNYATADDIRMHVAQKIGKHGLSYEQHEVGYTPFGSLIAVHYYFVLAHESGETGPPQRVSVLTQMVSQYGKPDDKAFSKATVLALKDWSKGKFSIATGDATDDPDSDATAPPQDRRAPPPTPPQQQRAAPPPPKQNGGAGQAFRTAGLPPKVEPKQPDPPSNGHDPETGEVIEPPSDDEWIYQTIHILTETKSGPGWLTLLDACCEACPSLTALDAIDSADTVVKKLNVARPETKDHIRTTLRNARKRLVEKLIPMDQPTATPDIEVEIPY